VRKMAPNWKLLALVCVLGGIVLGIGVSLAC
jgi:hypothetical protein